MEIASSQPRIVLMVALFTSNYTVWMDWRVSVHHLCLLGSNTTANTDKSPQAAIFVFESQV